MAATTTETPAVDRRARMKLAFEDLVSRPVGERLADFEPAYALLTEEQARRAAERCIHCPEEPCREACPVHNDISNALWLVEQGDFLGAARLYRQTSSLPEICGLVCPHEALCQGSCVRNKRGEPVLTGAIEAFVTHYERDHGHVEIPRTAPSGKRVAIVGSGPAGLACAERTVQNGHAVTIFEAYPHPGGLLTYGIPNFKLPKRLVDGRIDDLRRAGVRFESGIRIGRDRTVDELLAEGFDAVFLGVGSGIDSPMDVPGTDLPGVYLATEFLIRGNVDPSILPPGMSGRPSVRRKVAVVGGGDTASDCLRTALRLGAEEVTCLYRRTEAEMPGGTKDRELAREEGAKYRFLTQPIRFIAGQEGRVAAVECLQCELGEPDASGRRKPVPIEGSNFTVEADTVVLALGYWPDPLLGKSTPGLQTHKYGLIVADAETGVTSRRELFAGGDAVTGPDLVVTAMRAGRQAAASIQAFLASA